MFLLKRRTNPRFQFIILNKKSQGARCVFRWSSCCRTAAQTWHAQARFAASADNYVEDVLGGFQFEKSKPYLLYRNKKDEARPSTRVCTLSATVHVSY